jgi:hypothetical protein
MDNQRRNRNQWNRNEDAAPRKPEPRRDAGAYIGRMPERSTTPETGPGGMIRRDGRQGGFAPQAAPSRPDAQPLAPNEAGPDAQPEPRPDAQPAPVGAAVPASAAVGTSAPTSDDRQREAGENN